MKAEDPPKSSDDTQQGPPPPNPQPPNETVRQGTPEPSGPAPRIYLSEAELHYTSLVTYFQNMVTKAVNLVTWAAVCISFFLALSVWFSYQSVSDVKTDIRASMAGVREDAKLAIDSASTTARSAVDNTRTDARDAIAQTKTITELQASQIRDRAAAIALGEAQRRVDAAFRGDNVQLMVERAAKAQVAPVIERQLQSEVDRAMDAIQVDLEWTTQIADAGSYTRVGAREGIEKLRAIQRNAPTDKIRQRAGALLETIANGYEKNIKDEAKQGRFPSVYAMYGEQIDGPTLISELIKTIREDRSLYEVARAFIALSEKTGQRFRVFDFDAVQKWCEQNPTQCGK